MAAACTSTRRRVPNAVAVQRGLPLGSRETLPRTRYVVRDDGAPCSPTTGGAAGQTKGGVRTRCYGEHSPRRKTCRLLAPAPDFGNAYAPGLYVTGLPPLDDDGASLRCTRGDEEDEEHGTLVLGPYATDRTDGLAVKCMDLELVFEEFSHPENVALRFRVGNDRRIPSVEMMRRCARLVARHGLPKERRTQARNLVACADALQERGRTLQRLRTRCAQSAAFAREARRVLKHAFYFAMYARRWAGPGTPYPVTTRATNRRPGQHTAVSSDLVGKAVRATPAGEVVLRDARGGDDDDAADLVSEGKLSNMMYAHLRAAGVERETGLAPLLLLAVEGAPTVDGSYWARRETLHECLFTGDGSVASGKACIRQQSRALLETCLMLAHYVYRTPPAWMRLDDPLDDVQ